MPTQSQYTKNIESASKEGSREIPQVVPIDEHLDLVDGN